MKSPILITRFSLINRQQESVVDYSESGHDFSRIKVPLPETIGNAWISSTCGALNIILSHCVFESKKSVSSVLYQLATLTEKLSETALVLYTVRSGRVIVRDLVVGKEFIVMDGGECLIQFSDHLNYQIVLDKDEDVDAYIMIIENSVLQQLMGLEAAQALLHLLGLSHSPSSVMYNLPLEISKILHYSMPDNMSRNMYTLFAQARVLDFFCKFAEHINESRTGKLTLSKDKTIRLILEELKAQEGKLPTLDVIAGTYGLSCSTLCNEFKRLYGRSLLDYISEYRFNRCHVSLLKSDTPIKILAANMGYSHVNHFITAFVNKFGYPPGSLRRKSKQEFFPTCCAVEIESEGGTH